MISIDAVICRIGSLERGAAEATAEAGVICRIGSLEMFMIQEFTLKLVICRIGSLENNSPEYLISE